MKDFGLVVIGAHFGVWLEDKINEFRNDNILLVESFPYNNKVLKKNFSERKMFLSVKMQFFLKTKLKNFFLLRKNQYAN